MRKRLGAFCALFCSLLVVSALAAAQVDLRGYIDSGRVYSNSDSLEFTDVGSASYAGYSDTVTINGAQFISCDFLLTRNGKATANCDIQLQGSKDGTNYVNLDPENYSITVTAVGTTTLTFPYTPVYTFYRLYVDNDTLFSAITKWKVGGRTNAAR